MQDKRQIIEQKCSEVLSLRTGKSDLSSQIFSVFERRDFSLDCFYGSFLRRGLLTRKFTNVKNVYIAKWKLFLCNISHDIGDVRLYNNWFKLYTKTFRCNTFENIH